MFSPVKSLELFWCWWLVFFCMGWGFFFSVWLVCGVFVFVLFGFGFLGWFFLGGGKVPKRPM